MRALSLTMWRCAQTFDSYLSGGPVKDSIFVDCSTVAPTTTTELAARAADSGAAASAPG